ncbi:S26 family signal peptidase [Natrialbaceae archaeon AArc-T1-2]|uniref:S26 family signal peptidase n=1 Tax=Natrialbaceae archaeon AArc-T1-2 TaxID=3053904 RepID=UPI00255ADD5F|nr:S26 family signal peptidase [Natrialbaceae archaeon AArc-T1-2]WIV68534.1 S26 family signal peptidase [Natrialbaceae archaeon AArc-T1-2]
MSGPGPDDSSSGPHDSRNSRDDEGESDGDHDDDRRRDDLSRSEHDGRDDDSGSDGDGWAKPRGDSGPHDTGSSRRADGDRPTRSGGVTIEDDGVVRWFLKSDDGTVTMIRDVASSVAIVLLIGLVLFAVSGVWPPLVAVESGSMEPNMERGDMIFVVDENRFVGDEPIDGTGVVTYENGQNGGHEKFGEPGDVIIFEPNGDEFQTPVIHRAHYWVEEDDNWVDEQADPEHLNGATCEDLTTCPADHDGFITKGDANSGYDQAGSGAPTDVVSPEWVTGKASVRIPWLGHVRLVFDSLLVSSPSQAGSTPGPGPNLGPDRGPASGGSSGLQVGLVAVASVAAIAGSRRPGSW